MNMKDKKIEVACEEAAIENILFLVATVGMLEDVTITVLNVSDERAFVEKLVKYKVEDCRHLSEFEKLCAVGGSYSLPDVPEDDDDDVAFTTENFCTSIFFEKGNATDNDAMPFLIEICNPKKRKVSELENRAEKTLCYWMLDTMGGGNLYIELLQEAYKNGKEDEFIHERLQVLIWDCKKEDVRAERLENFRPFLEQYPRFNKEEESKQTKK